MRFNKLYEELKKDEGIVSHIYVDTEGFRTFGIGHKVVLGDPEWHLPVGAFVSNARIDECFREDVKQAVNNCRSLFGSAFDLWNDEVQEVLVNMVFNLGLTGVSKFKKFRAALDKADWKEAAKEGRDSLWYTQVPNRAERLMARLEAI